MEEEEEEKVEEKKIRARRNIRSFALAMIADLWRIVRSKSSIIYARV